MRGVRILDLTRHLPGPYCTLLLHDLGAEVIKVEDPRGGDPARFVPPFDGHGRSLAFTALNRGKRSVALDLKSDAGRAAFLHLVGGADVLVEGFRPGVLARLGLAYDRLRAHNERLVYCAITGYGQDGPRAAHGGHDLNYLAASGALGLSNEPGGAPSVPGYQAADVVGGAMFAAVRILAALIGVRATGRGVFVDVSMAEGAMALWALSAGAAAAGLPSAAEGDGLLTGRRACYAVYETADGGFVTLAALEPKFWANFCKAVARPAWIPRHMAGGAEARVLREEVAALFRSRPLAHWEALARQVDCCLEPVRTPREALGDASIYRGPPPPAHPESAAHLRTPVLPPHQAPAGEAAPALGEHTRAVLEEAGAPPDVVAACSSSLRS